MKTDVLYYDKAAHYICICESVHNPNFKFFQCNKMEK